MHNRCVYDTLGEEEQKYRDGLSGTSENRDLAQRQLMFVTGDVRKTIYERSAEIDRRDLRAFRR